MQKSLTCLLVGEEEEEGEEEVVGERRFQLSVHPVNVLHRESGGERHNYCNSLVPKSFFFLSSAKLFSKVSHQRGRRLCCLTFPNRL